MRRSISLVVSLALWLALIVTPTVTSANSPATRHEDFLRELPNEVAAGDTTRTLNGVVGA
jgi:hypothetical protein